MTTTSDARKRIAENDAQWQALHDDRNAARAEVERLRGLLESALASGKTALEDGQALLALTKKQGAQLGAIAALADEYERDRDVCVSWLHDPPKIVDSGHPARLSLMAETLNTFATRLRTILADAAGAIAKHEQEVRAHALREFADTRGVNVGDEDDEWWKGYRQAQRECLRDAVARADALTEGRG